MLHGTPIQAYFKITEAAGCFSIPFRHTHPKQNIC